LSVIILVYNFDINWIQILIHINLWVFLNNETKELDATVIH